VVGKLTRLPALLPYLLLNFKLWVPGPSAREEYKSIYATTATAADDDDDDDEVEYDNVEAAG